MASALRFKNSDATRCAHALLREDLTCAMRAHATNSITRFWGTLGLMPAILWPTLNIDAAVLGADLVAE